MPQINDLTLLTSPTGTESALVSDAGGTLKRILVNTIAQFTHPVGSAYTQYYGLPTPSTLWGGTWALKYNNDAISLMTEGSAGATYEAETFDGVVKDSQMQGHYHASLAGTSFLEAGSVTNLASGVAFAFTQSGTTGNPSHDLTNGGPRTGKATKPRRVIVRIWERIA